jgi:hypothetical protein
LSAPAAAAAGANPHRRYTRDHPSPQYTALLGFYRDMHREGYRRRQGQTEEAIAGANAYPGDQLLHYARPIGDLIRRHGVRRLLDYGAGKGAQYREDLRIRLPDGSAEFPGIKAYWGVQSVECYEPALGNPPPDGRYGGVICTDVLEHCFAGDLPWIVDELFGLAEAFVFANVACYPASALLPNGENAHVTLRPAAWWQGFFEARAAQFPECDYLLACGEIEAGGRLVNRWFPRQAYESGPRDRFSR